jgi:4-amino-4-deoxy-L-arabinose transferase-like glycosyltransferase
MSETTNPQSPPPTHPPRIHPLIWILLVGAAARLVLWYAWAGWSPLINDDARDYQRLAIGLATTGRYADANGKPISLRPPLYPAMLAGIYLGCGLENDAAVRAVQAGIGLLTTVFVYRLGRIVYDRRVALWAAVMCCFYPSLLGYSNLLLSETLFTFMVAAFVLSACKAIHQQRNLALVAAGIVMGLAALTRSIMLLFTPIFALFVLLSWRGSWRRRILAAALPIAMFAAVIAPWAVRNTRLQQTLTFIDVMGGRNAMMGNYEFTPLERSWATITDVTGERSWHNVLVRENGSEYVRASQGQRDKIALRHAIRFVTTHPWLTIERSFVKFFNFWQLDRLLVAASQEGYFGDISVAAKLALAAVICGSYAALLFAAIFGICCVSPGDRRIHWFLIASILFPCAVHTLIFAHSRYHLPIVPLLTLYAAAAIVNWPRVYQRRNSASFLIAAALCVVVALGWVREFVFVDYASMM